MAYREGPFENLRVPLTWLAGLVMIGVVVVSIVLLIGDRGIPSGEQAPGPVRAGFERVAAPANGLFAAPVRWAGAATDYVQGYFFAVGENRRLKREVQELQSWRDQAIALKNVNARYEAMLGLRTEPAVRMVTGRSVSESRGPLSTKRLIDVGAAKGVKVGNPVINEHGLVGRVVGAIGNVSRVMLLTDVASQTPILIDRTDARAILKGDGSGNPRLEFIRGTDAVRNGDRVLSSGDGGSLPRGLPIGVAARGIDGTWRVKLFSDRGAIDFVRVMLFEDFSQLAHPEQLNAPPLVGLSVAPPPSPELAAQIRDAQARRDADAVARLRQQQETQAAQAAAAAAARAARTAPPPAPASSPQPTPPAATTGPPPASRPTPATASAPTRSPASRPTASSNAARLNAQGTPRRPVPYRATGPAQPVPAPGG